MALLSVEEEMERAQPTAPFSNSTDGFGWMSIWCDECAQEADCPLLLVAMMNRTPAAWVLREPLGINKYTCIEYQEAKGGEEATV
jgi:hypothetical protein